MGDLAQLALAMLRGEPNARTSFWDEPGELRVVAHGADDEIALEVRAGNGDYYSGADESEPVLQISTRCARRELAIAILRCLDQTLERYDLTGYHRLWQMSVFPSNAHLALRRALHDGA